MKIAEIFKGFLACASTFLASFFTGLLLYKKINNIGIILIIIGTAVFLTFFIISALSKKDKTQLS